jgi:hypothetical protein
MELAAAIFGESGLEVDIERLGRAVPGPVLTDDDSELDEYSSDDSDYAPSDGSDSQSASESDESDESDESEDDEVAEGAFGPSPAMMMPGMPGSPVVSFMSGGGMGAPMMMGAPMPGCRRRSRGCRGVLRRGWFPDPQRALPDETGS